MWPGGCMTPTASLHLTEIMAEEKGLQVLNVINLVINLIINLINLFIVIDFIVNINMTTTTVRNIAPMADVLGRPDQSARLISDW